MEFRNKLVIGIGLNRFVQKRSKLLRGSPESSSSWRKPEARSPRRAELYEDTSEFGIWIVDPFAAEQVPQPNPQSPKDWIRIAPASTELSSGLTQVAEPDWFQTGPYWTEVHGLQDWPATAITVLDLQTHTYSLKALLEASRGLSDSDALATLSETLFDVCRRDAAYAKALSQWLSSEGYGWIVERVPALGSVVEAATRISAEGIGDFVAQVLEEDNALADVALVALQRVRLLKLDDPLRERLWRAAQGWLDRWEKRSELAAQIAIPSVAYLARQEAASWLSLRITDGSYRVAASAALAAIDLSGGRVSGMSLATQDRQLLFDSLMLRLRRAYDEHLSAPPSVPDLPATLVWALGTTATSRSLDAAAEAVAKAFHCTHGVSDAAAVRSGRLLVQRFGNEAVTTLGGAFGGINSQDFSKYLAALV